MVRVKFFTFLLLIAFTAIDFTVSQTVTVRPCTPSMDPAFRHNGFCVPTELLSTFCKETGVSMSTDCEGAESWCCYKRESTEIRQSVQKQSSGSSSSYSNSYGSSTTMAGTTTTNTPMPPPTTTTTKATTTAATTRYSNTYGNTNGNGGSSGGTTGSGTGSTNSGPGATTTPGMGTTMSSHTTTPGGLSCPYNNDPQPDMNQTAMLIVDAQVGTMTWARTTPLQYAQKYIIALANVSKALNLPLVLTSSLENNTNVQGPLMPELQQIAPTEFANRIKRVGVISAWDDPNYRNAVYATGKKQLIIAGFLTDVCIVHTACQARQEGFEVWVVGDAVGSPTAPAEYASRQRLILCGVHGTDTNGIIANIVKDWSTPLGLTAINNLIPAIIPGVPQLGFK